MSKSVSVCVRLQDQYEGLLKPVCVRVRERERRGKNCFCSRRERWNDTVLLEEEGKKRRESRSVWSADGALFHILCLTCHPLHAKAHTHTHTHTHTQSLWATGSEAKQRDKCVMADIIMKISTFTWLGIDLQDRWLSGLGWMLVLGHSCITCEVCVCVKQILRRVCWCVCVCCFVHDLSCIIAV